jgi:hypothetical protein
MAQDLPKDDGSTPPPVVSDVVSLAPHDDAARTESGFRGVHLRLPIDVYNEILAEATAERLPMTHFCYQLVVKRPVKIVRDVVLPDDAKVMLARMPKLEKDLADMTKNWETRKNKYADLEKKMTEETARTTKQVADLTAQNKALAHRESLLKKELDDLKKKMSTPRVIECECGEEIRVDFSDEVLKHTGKPKP